MAVTSTADQNGVYEFPYRKPNDKTKWETVRTAVWDPSTGAFCGRTGKSWGQLLLAYAIFYAILGALFYICMQGLMATLDAKVPRWQQDASLIGTNPGLGFRPLPSRTEEGSLIWYNQFNETTKTKWIKLLDEFFASYETASMGTNTVNCDFDKRPAAGQVCKVDVNNFGKCSRNEDYGYNSTSPCIFLKLNRIYGWVPDCYNDPNDLPKEMPQMLVDEIKRLAASDATKSELNRIWVSCIGEHPVDRESFDSYEVYPKGFAGYYYPYTNDDGYQSPLVAVRIVNPKPNVMVSIECRAWAKNIIYRGGNLQREGSVHFEVMVDDYPKKAI